MFAVLTKMFKMRISQKEIGLLISTSLMIDYCVVLVINWLKVFGVLRSERVGKLQLPQKPSPRSRHERSEAAGANH